MKSRVAAINETPFDTRRAFCEANGLSEDMLSYVLFGTLTAVPEKTGSRPAIVPLPKTRVE